MRRRSYDDLKIAESLYEALADEESALRVKRALTRRKRLNGCSVRSPPLLSYWRPFPGFFFLIGYLNNDLLINYKLISDKLIAISGFFGSLAGALIAVVIDDRQGRVALRPWGAIPVAGIVAAAEFYLVHRGGFG